MVDGNLAPIERRELRCVRPASTLSPPRRPDRVLPSVAINVVLVREIDSPQGDEPVEWILVTTLPIDTEEDVRKIIQYYLLDG